MTRRFLGVRLEEGVVHEGSGGDQMVNLESGANACGLRLQTGTRSSSAVRAFGSRSDDFWIDAQSRHFPSLPFLSQQPSQTSPNPRFSRMPGHCSRWRSPLRRPHQSASFHCSQPVLRQSRMNRRCYPFSLPSFQGIEDNWCSGSSSHPTLCCDPPSFDVSERPI